MAHELTWSPAARLDLKEVFAYIVKDDPITAREFIQRLFGSVERLPVFPESGRVVPESKDPTIREIIYRPCRIVYRIKARQNQVEVEIARVWHAARGVPEID